MCSKHVPLPSFVKFRFNSRFMKINTNIKCFVVVSASALCGLLCWIQVLGAVLSESTPTCCVVDGFLLGGFKFLGVFFCVLQPPLVLLLSLGATFGELNPPLPPILSLLCC